MDHFSSESSLGSSFSAVLQVARGNLSQEQSNSMARDIMIASVVCNIYVILQGLAIIYSILCQIFKSKTNAQKITNRLNWLSALIITFIVSMDIVIMAVVITNNRNNKWSDFVLDSLITFIVIAWLVHWRESVRVLIKKRFTKAVNNCDNQKV